MLSYAFINLRKEEYKKLGSENFENIYDLLAEILYLGFLELLKRGVNREYIERQEDFSTIRGKIDLTETLRIKNILKRKISCIYEDFSTNAYLNQILKTTFSLLLKSFPTNTVLFIISKLTLTLSSKISLSVFLLFFFFLS